MDIRCPSCSKLFRVADEKIAGKGIRFKCSKCSEVITITKDDFEMDLLAREGEAASPAVQPPPPAPKPVAAPTPPPSTSEPEAREYKPPADQQGAEEAAVDQAIPPSSLTDFDFSEPHAAAAAAAHPDDGFGGAGLSFDASAEQGAAPEIEISPEAAAEAETALQFPADLISEPKRKPAFGTAAPEVPAPEAVPGPEDQETGLGDAIAIPTGPEGGDAPATTDQEIDLGAALAMPMGPVSDDGPAATGNESVPEHAPAAPKGPVISPELLAQMKRKALERSATSAKTTPPMGDDIDLGAALAMPKTTESADKEKAEADTGRGGATQAGETTSSSRTLLVSGVIALLLVVAVAVLYSMGYLAGISGPEAQKPASPPRSAPKLITHEGLSIVDPAAFFDPERRDIVITGKIVNALDKPKAGWFLVTEVRDAKEAVLATVTMVNGTQMYTERDRELLAKRGMKPEHIRGMSAAREGKIPAGGSVSFEVRVLDPPAGSARFMPVLKTFDPAILE